MYYLAIYLNIGFKFNFNFKKTITIDFLNFICFEKFLILFKSVFLNLYKMGYFIIVIWLKFRIFYFVKSYFKYFLLNNLRKDIFQIDLDFQI